jgi:hypothetical protein
VLPGEVFAEPNPHPMFPDPPGPLCLEPYSEGVTGSGGGRLQRRRYLGGEARVKSAKFDPEA